MVMSLAQIVECIVATSYFSEARQPFGSSIIDGKKLDIDDEYNVNMLLLNFDRKKLIITGKCTWNGDERNGGEKFSRKFNESTQIGI